MHLAAKICSSETKTWGVSLYLRLPLLKLSLKVVVIFAFISQDKYTNKRKRHTCKYLLYMSINIFIAEGNWRVC